MTVRVFVDFDGTVTQGDVGNAFFRKFGGERCDEYVRSYRNGVLSAAQCFTAEAAAMGEFSRSEAEAFVRSQAIDQTFAGLLSFAQQRGYQVTVVSDGLDFYIREILAANNIDVPFVSNRATLVPVGAGDLCTLSIDFPYEDESCSRCACCKRNIMLTQSGDDDVMVLVGEGYSDICPARYADIVFAKKELQSYCQTDNISYFPYLDFDDVVSKLEAMTAKGKPLRRRARAALNRRTAFKDE